jgi:hypothetical protein
MRRAGPDCAGSRRGGTLARGRWCGPVVPAPTRSPVHQARDVPPRRTHRLRRPGPCQGIACRSNAPVEMCGMPRARDTRSDCVPFPDPGGPAMSNFIWVRATSGTLDARRPGHALLRRHHAELFQLRPSAAVLLEVRLRLPSRQPRGRGERAEVVDEHAVAGQDVSARRAADRSKVATRKAAGI